MEWRAEGFLGGLYQLRTPGGNPAAGSGNRRSKGEKSRRMFWINLSGNRKERIVAGRKRSLKKEPVGNSTLGTEKDGGDQ